jgi:hypothetical protein
MSYLDERWNRIWLWLIEHDRVNPVWKPLVEMTRRRHVHCRRKLAQPDLAPGRPGQIVSEGV